MRQRLLFTIIVVVILLLWLNPFFIIDETEQGIVLVFEKPRKVITESSSMPHWKWPFIERVQRYEKRIMVYDSAPKDINTKDLKLLWIDNYCRWRITDPQKFYSIYQTYKSAQSRIDDVVYAQLRVEVAKYTMVEVVAEKREEIMQKVITQSHDLLSNSGIEIIDVRIKRADLPQENAASVFSRMEAERKQQAQLYRSEGEQEYLTITSEAQRDVQIILSEAYKEAEETRGEGEAEALKIYAEAFSKDPEFYEFWRTLQAYRNALKGDTTLVLSSDSEFLKFLKSYE